MTTNYSESQITKESVFLIGNVISVEGRIIRIKVNKNKNTSHLIYNGEIVKNISVGSYIKIVKGFIQIIGKVEGEYISEDKKYNLGYSKPEEKINRILQVSIFGHIYGQRFKQGIKEIPLIDNECYLLNKDEFNNLHKFYKDSDEIINIGSLSDEVSQTVNLSINKLFTSHIGIFGNTGSGKSNTLARIYTELFDKISDKPFFLTKSKFIFIDFNGEYVGNEMFCSNKKIYKLNTHGEGDKILFRKEYFNSIENISLLLDAKEKVQRPFLSRAIDMTFSGSIAEQIKSTIKDILSKNPKETGETNLLNELVNNLRDIVNNTEDVNDFSRFLYENLSWHNTGNSFYLKTSGGDIYYNARPTEVLSTINEYLDRLSFKNDEFSILQAKILLQYFEEIIKGYANKAFISPIIGRMRKRFASLVKIIDIVDNDTNGPNIDIISLKDTNLEIKKIIPLIIVKSAYDSHKRETNQNKFLNIIIDEAHNILSTNSERESETWKDYRLETFEEIIKEGRKFGVFLTIASQRPFDISQTIISQLHNYFIHRLINNNDIEAVRKTVAYLDKLSFDSIPVLSVGSCFIAGLVTDIPIKVDVKILDENKQPHSGTINLIKCLSEATTE